MYSISVHIHIHVKYSVWALYTPVPTGPQPAILDWYGHCMGLSANKVGGSGGMLPQENFFKFSTLRSLLRPCLGRNATRMSPPVVSVAREAIEPSSQK